MDPLVFVFGAALGFAAAFVAVYSQNWIPGVLILGAGVVVLFGGSFDGPSSIIDNLFEAVGVEGLIAVLVGGGAGAYAGERYRAQSKPS